MRTTVETSLPAIIFSRAGTDEYSVAGGWGQGKLMRDRMWQQRARSSIPHTLRLRATQVRNDKSENAEGGMDSREGWHSWLVILSLGGHKQIVAQEILDRHTASEKVAQR